jgi:predicted ATPase
VLATSREAIGIGGEQRYPVPPLPTPDPDQRLTPDDLDRYESMALFLARARAAAPGLTMTDEDRIAALRLCGELDGLPLAIELAAARVRVLTAPQIRDRLAVRFALLTGGARDAPARHQTLRACVEWSFDLCGEQERLLWARLSVFVGGFELDAVEGICDDEALPAADILDVLSGLVDKSIVDRVDRGGDSARYRMVETVRGVRRTAADRGRDVDAAAPATPRLVSGAGRAGRGRMARPRSVVLVRSVEPGTPEPAGRGGVLPRGAG